MIQISKEERIKIVKKYPKKQFAKSGKGRSSNYYIFSSDKQSLKIIAKLRNQSISEIIKNEDY